MNETIRYFSMFTGVGGFELGFGHNYTQSTEKKCEQTKFEEKQECRRFRPSNESGWNSILPRCPQPTSDSIFKCIGFSEIDKYASELLKKRFPDVPNFGDCTKINPDELPDFDMLCGGFPCQAFSIAGKRRGFEDTRGTMFFEIARIVKAKRPKIVFLENVKGLLNHNKGETFQVILETLDELGYETQWMVLNSKFFGVPQNRERVFIIGSIRGESRPEILPFRSSYQEINGKYGKPQAQISGTITQRYWKCGNTDTYIKSVAYRTRTYAGKEGGIEMRHDDVSNQLTTIQKDSMVMHSLKIRRLTPIECERLQGFPDNWTEGFSDTQRYRMMGNAVTVNVIRAIAQRLIVRKSEEVK